MGSIGVRVSLIGIVVLATALLAAPAQAGKGGKSKKDVLVVCKHGCEYRKIQSAVDDSRGADVIKVKKGKYREGVIVEGHKHDGLTIKGVGKKASKKVILEGKDATSENGLAQNGIEGVNVDKLKILNMWARNYATNGFFIHGESTTKRDCVDFTMKNLRASFNRAYGLYVFNCVGGQMAKSAGWGHGDSAYYVGATPPQENPKETELVKLKAYENVLGYSGTNSRYVRIHKSDFFNNGVGLVPNTLDSEPFEPSSEGVIEHNNIFWNNFNYFLPDSTVETISDGLGELGPPFFDPPRTLQYPTGVGVALFGATGWQIRNNEIFGNFKWGVGAFSDPFNDGDEAISTDNQMTDNTMGRGGTDTNAVDFWVDGSGSGNCFSGNASSTFDPSGSATNAFLYPECPAPAPPTSGTGTGFGDAEQLGELVNYVASTPPETQECAWTKHDHPAFEDYEPLVVTPGPTCP